MILCGMNAQTVDDTSHSVTGVIKQMNEAASAHESADESSPVTLELKSGDYIYVTGESDGWYQIYYRGETMYVDNTVPVTDRDHSAEIAAELTGMQITDTAWIDEYQMQVRAIKTARNWRILIAVLIVAFIGVTAFSTFRKKPDTDVK